MTDLILTPDAGEPEEMWERQRGEGMKAFSAFNAYRKLAPHERSLRHAVKEQYGDVSSSKLRQFQTWSVQWHWVARAMAWDDKVEDESRREHIKSVKDMQKRHIQISMAVQQKAIDRLKKLTEQDIYELTMSDVIRFLRDGIMLERLSRGEPETIVEERSKSISLNIEGELAEPLDFAKLPDEELRHILLQKRETLLLAAGKHE